MAHILTITDVADENIRQAILAPLRAYNDSQAGPSQGRPLVIQVKDQMDVTLGGLWGYTGYGWHVTAPGSTPLSSRRAAFMNVWATAVLVNCPTTRWGSRGIS